MSKTACIVPWSTLAVGPDGRAAFCCEASSVLTVGGRMGNIYRDSLDDLWNGPEIVEVRSAMARGEKPDACRLCWEREEQGGVSRRLLSNSIYAQIGGRLPIDALAREGASTGYRLERRPDWFVLALGNVCNLKCRSCSPLYSSAIAADPVHAAWAANEPAPEPGTDPSSPSRRRLRLVPEDRHAWFEDVETVADMIATGADGNATLSLVGGEPFLTDATWRLLRALVARGAAPHLTVGLASNGQQRSAELADLAPRFRRVTLSLSIDGHDKVYEYLRHGAKWRTLVDNLRWFRQLPGVQVITNPTLQNCNVLDMVTLLRFFDEHGLPMAYNVLNWPSRLRATNLPPRVRGIAAQRLRRYLDEECPATNLAVVNGYLEALEGAGEAFDAEAFAEFMAFTNDLDAARGQSLREAAPELWALIRAAGVEWSSERRHVPVRGGNGAAAKTPHPPAPHQAVSAPPPKVVNRTLSSRDAIFPGFEAVQRGAYFGSGSRQLAEIDALLRRHGHVGLERSRAVADYACHYGRLTRALRAALPHAAIYACDIDRDAVRFCADELGALPVVTGWQPDEESLPAELDVVICLSLLTHTPLEHWRRTLRAWARMLRPGGVAAFTFLSEHHIEGWLGGAMAQYGSYSQTARAETARTLGEQGFGFTALTAGYGGKAQYGIAFGVREVVRREIAAAGLELLEISDEVSPAFAQDLALARKPDEAAPAPRAEPRVPEEIRRDVRVIALYDPRCYAPAGAENTPIESVWARLTAVRPPPPLPSELGFGDPRVPEVREAQAALAGGHGVDAFCWLYPWGPSGARWDQPLRDLVSTGRPDFPFCVMVALEEESQSRGERVPVATATRLLDELALALGDGRYVRVDGRPILLVRDVARLADPRATAAAWRARAVERGLGEIHLCAAEPAPANRPGDLGFDSFLEAQPQLPSNASVVAAALTRPWPSHRFFRAVRCQRAASDPLATELYEHWLRSAVDATRARGESLVFVHSWNDWLGNAYLEPDDHDGRAALLATRRAARGPSSGLVLLRRLRDALGEVEAPAAAAFRELEQVLALHEHTRDQLLATVDLALGGSFSAARKETLRWVPVASRQLPASSGAFCLDRVDGTSGPALHGAPISLPVSEVLFAGWAHSGDCEPGAVDLFLALESSTSSEDRVFRITKRVSRPDVVRANPGHPEHCGFAETLDLTDVPPGTYRVVIVQRTPHGAYRDVTPVEVRRD